MSTTTLERDHHAHLAAAGGHRDALWTLWTKQLTEGSSNGVFPLLQSTEGRGGWTKAGASFLAEARQEVLLYYKQHNRSLSSVSICI